ncbi:hypothetical protein ACE41K_34425, partial [Bacillus cereus]
RIRILDATIFQVPKHLAHVYPGSGGCAQTAGIKIQLGVPPAFRKKTTLRIFSIKRAVILRIKRLFYT